MHTLRLLLPCSASLCVTSGVSVWGSKRRQKREILKSTVPRITKEKSLSGQLLTLGVCQTYGTVLWDNMLHTWKLAALSLAGAFWEKTFSDPLRFFSSWVCKGRGSVAWALSSQLCLVVTELRNVLLPERSNMLDCWDKHMLFRPTLAVFFITKLRSTVCGTLASDQVDLQNCAWSVFAFYPGRLEILLMSFWERLGRV